MPNILGVQMNSEGLHIPVLGWPVHYVNPDSVWFTDYLIQT